MSLELALGGALLLAGLWFASTALFPSGPQARALSGAGGVLSRGVRGIFADPAPVPAAFVDAAGRPGTAMPPAAARRAGAATASGRTVAVGEDPALAVTLQQTLTVLEEVLAQLPALLARAEAGGRADRSGSHRSGGSGSSRGNLTVSRLVGESLPPALARTEGPPASPFFTRLFELCEEELDVAEEPAPRPVVATRVPPPPAEPDPGRVGNDGFATDEATELPNDPSEGTPMSNPNDPPSSDVAYQRGEISADVAAEMFEVAMAALAQALVDDERAVREASIRALGGIDPGAIRRWASVKLLTGDADDMAAAARIVSALELEEVLGEVLERALEAGAQQRDRAVGALRALAPSAELLERTVAQVGEGQRARLPVLLPELFQGPALADMLQVLVRDPSEQVRMASLDAIAAHADRDTVLRVASNVIAVDQSPSVRVVAADLLGRAGTSSPHRTEATAEIEPEDAPVAALPDDPAVLWDLLLDRAGRGDDGVIAEAAEHVRDTLMAAALTHADDADPSARALAVRAALRAGTEDGVVIAMLALADPDPQVRRAAVEVCQRTDAAEATTALRRLVTDPDYEVRKAAVTALVGSEEPEATEALVRTLADPEDDIRTLAQSALLGRTTPEVARLLVDELEVAGRRQAAAEILRAMEDTGRQAVEQAMPSLSREAIVAAGPVLAAVPGSADRYLADLSSLDVRARLRAVRALGAIGGQQAVTALVGRLHDPVDEIRIEALDHLGRMAGPDVVPLLRRIRAGDPIPAVGAAAERAVNQVLERADGA